MTSTYRRGCRSRAQNVTLLERDVLMDTNSLRSANLVDVDSYFGFLNRSISAVSWSWVDLSCEM